MKVISMLSSGRDKSLRPCLLADSALAKGIKPFFIPDGQGPVSATAALAVTIGRLGKSIEERFVARYIKDISPAVIFRDEGRLSALSAQGAPLSDALSFDGSVHVGSPFPEGAPPHAVICSVSDTSGVIETAFAPQAILGSSRWLSLIADYSKVNTLRTGDIFLFDADTLLLIQTKRRRHLEIRANGIKLLSFNIL